MAEKLRFHQVEIINLQYSPVMYPDSFKIAWNKLARNFVSTVSFHTLWGGSKLNMLFAWRLLYTANGVIATKLTQRGKDIVVVIDAVGRNHIWIVEYHLAIIPDQDIA